MLTSAPEKCEKPDPDLNAVLFHADAAFNLFSSLVVNALVL
ncbi:hypothetical protein [Listeria rocourtiae]|nr:hypothetical protein [Listeria rocourtiae]